MAAYWRGGRFRIDLSQPKIMGIVNLTPDSFSDGGTYSQSTRSALKHAERLLAEGADILDIGGESTRPGAAHVPPATEWARVRPVLQEAASWNVPVSLDTRRTEVMRQALELGGVDIINDVSALTAEGALQLLAQQPATGVCLMHMQGLPATMQERPEYGNVVGEVAGYLKQRAEACRLAGIAAERIVLDPGFGFGKNLAHNAELMHGLQELARQTGLPLLVGVSRKRMIGELTGENEAAARVHGSVAAALAAVARGAALVRVHDVKATADALKTWQALGLTAKESAEAV